MKIVSFHGHLYFSIIWDAIWPSFLNDGHDRCWGHMKSPLQHWWINLMYYIQQLPVINCSFWPAKIVRIRGLCDYPSIGPLIDEGDDQPILMVKLQPTEWNITRKERILPCSQLPADWPIWSILKLQFHMTAKTEDWCTLDTATMLHKYSNGHRVGIQTPYNLSILL